MTYLRSQAKKGEDPIATFPVLSGKPQNVKITGDTAVAEMDGKELKFAKIGQVVHPARVIYRFSIAQAYASPPSHACCSNWRARSGFWGTPSPRP